MPKYSSICLIFCCLLGLVPNASAQSTQLAGINYNPQLPLEAKEVQRKDGEGKPLPVYRVSFKGGSDSDVPGLLGVPSTSAVGKRPAVILLHGLGGDKNQLQALAMMFNGKGLVTLAIDAAGHGERPKFHGKPITELDLDETRTVAAQTVQDLRRATDYLCSRSDVDPKRIAFVGVSLGGILGARFLADEPRVACASLWVAGGDWGKLITTSAHPWAKAFRQRGQTDPEKIRLAMQDVDPVPAMGHAIARPILFLNGESDDVVPRACSDALIAATKGPKENFLLPGGHIPNLLDMASRTIAFLTTRLK